MGQSHCEDSPYFIGIQIHASLAEIMIQPFVIILLYGRPTIFIMRKKETSRLIKEGNILIRHSPLKPKEKKNLRRNIRYFMSRVSKDNYVAKCKWTWFDEGEDRHGLDLNWDWKDVKGVFGFYADNGHGFSFEFGKNGEGCYVGGESGEYGFSCWLFLSDLEGTLKHMGY